VHVGVFWSYNGHVTITWWPSWRPTNRK